MVNLAEFQAGLTDTGAERNVIACLIKSMDAWIRLPSYFGQEEFQAPINKAFWSIIDNLYSKGAAIDPVVVYEALPKMFQDELKDLGGWSYIQVLKDLPIDPSNILYEAQKLIDLSTRRRIDSAGDKLKQEAKATKELGEVRETIENIFSSIERESDTENVANIAANGYEFLKKKLQNPSEVPGIKSGFPEIDRIVQGFLPGRLYVVGARKKTGKSMLLLNWAKHIAIDQKIPVLWISTEHTIDDEYSRLLSLTSGVHEMAINNGTFSKIDRHVERVADASEVISKSPFYFVSMPFFSLDKIRRLTRKMARVDGVKIVFFDYIKAPGDDAITKEWQELGKFTYGLKALGVAESIPIVSAVQINREGQQSFKLDGEIDSDSFAGSDRIAQALSVAFILRNPNGKEANGDSGSFRVLRVSDNRHGPSGLKMLIDFHGETIRMEENKCL